MINTDAYKLSHKGFMVEGTEVIYSNLTPRSDKYFNFPKEHYHGGVVFYGLQYFVKEFLIEEMNSSFFNLPIEVAVGNFKKLIDSYLGKGKVSMEHFEDLHKLGFLPIEIRALPEGTLCPIKVPMLTIHNTHPRFAWLTNYLETVMSCEIWKPITTATTMYHYRKMVNQFAMKTTGSTAGTEFQLHDFSFRGMSGRHDASINGSAFLLSSNGTDTVPALGLIQDYYDTDLSNEFIATSVPASEHSLASAGIAVSGELETFRKWIKEDYPTGIVSIIADTLDFFQVVTDYATELKEDILNRGEDELGLSKVVFRPDSGNPADILCGTSASKPETSEEKGAVECLWDIFGGTINELGFKVLNPKVGLIYGDSMTPDMALEVMTRLTEKGFATTNVVFGVGSYTIQYVTRDTLGMAVKATASKINGEWVELYKNPKTDSGVKKSAKGLLKVIDNNGELQLIDQCSLEEINEGLLKPIFKNGNLLSHLKFSDIKKTLWNQ